MEVFKLAFETIIIGLFALPCLLVIIDATNPDLFSSGNLSALTRAVPPEVRPQAIALTLFPVVYLLGVMMTPVAFEFLNDKDMLAKFLPNEESIQAQTYKQMGLPAPPACDLAPTPKPAGFVISTTPAQKTSFELAIHNEFLHEESTLLLRGSQGNGRINRLHERLTVLQGATFCAFALMVLCGFAWCGARCAEPDVSKAAGDYLRQGRRLVGLLLSAGLIALALKQLGNDVHHPDTGDMPIAELVFLILGGFGLYVALQGVRPRLHCHGVIFLLAFCFTLLCYTGYASTEMTYNQEIFDAYRALIPPNTGSHRVQSAALPPATSE